MAPLKNTSTEKFRKIRKFILRILKVFSWGACCLMAGDSIMTDRCIKLFPRKDVKLCHRYHSFINLVGKLEHVASLYIY